MVKNETKTKKGEKKKKGNGEHFLHFVSQCASVSPFLKQDKSKVLEGSCCKDLPCCVYEKTVPPSTRFIQEKRRETG